MTAYDRLRAAALDTLARNLPQNVLGPEERAQLLDAISQMSFPAFLALLGTSGAGGDDLGQPLLRAAAEGVAGTTPAKQLHLGADQVEHVLTAVFTHGAAPDAVMADPAARDVVLRTAIDQLGTRVGIPITPDEASQAIQLLATGEFFGDLASALAAAAFAVRNLPIDLVRDVGHLPFRLIMLGAAVTRDLVGTPFVSVRVLGDLLDDGKLDHPPAVLRHTTACLLGFATLATTARTISDLIAPRNRSIRLAIVIYARANGIPLQESDLDVLRTNVLNTDTPDLGPVLVAGVSRLLARGGKDQLLTTLRQIAATRA